MEPSAGVEPASISFVARGPSARPRGQWCRNLVSTQGPRGFQPRALRLSYSGMAAPLGFEPRLSALTGRRATDCAREQCGTRGGSRTLTLLRATVSETVVSTGYTTRVWLEWRESNSRPRRSERRAQANMSHIPAMAVPMGDDPTTSRSTTERSSVELRNHWRVEPESHRRVESLQLSALTAWRPTRDDGLGFEPRSIGPKPIMLPCVAPSVSGAIGGICARTPALATQCSARRTPIAWLVEPRGIEPAIR